MNGFSDELRLALVVLLNGGVFTAAYCLARRRGTGGVVQAICDAFLLYFLVQYAAVALPGVFGVFSTLTMSAVALAAAAGMSIAAIYSTPFAGTRNSGNDRAAPSHKDSQRGKPGATPKLQYSTVRRAAGPSTWNADRLGLLACTLFAAAYLGDQALNQRPLPPVATDALVYHLPTAVQWIQTHRLGIYPTWYWNPAASYSPGTGSIFMAWWMAPAGNDVFVRFVQLPPLIFVFFLVVRMCRLMGAGRTVAGLIAVAATLSRPLFSEAIFPKDDLFVTGFIAAAVLALADAPMRDRLGPWRAGIAIGFVLASKYTALMICPILLFMVDSPLRARLRLHQWAIAIGLVLAMALPWYIRNIVLTGNPLYPVDVSLFGLRLRGLFSVERDQQLRSAGGVWKMLASTYHSVPAPVIVLLLLGWLGAGIAAGRSQLREPLPRACVIGSAVTLAIFLALSPHHEVRYLFPVIVLCFAAVGLGLARGLPRQSWQIAAAGLLAAVSIATTLESSHISEMAELAGVAGAITAAGVASVWLQSRIMHLRGFHLAVIGSTAGLLLAMYAFVEWHIYVETYRISRFPAWAVGYPGQAPLWQWVDENVPADASVAYANTFLVYPFYGFNFTRHVVYAPVSQYPRAGPHESAGRDSEDFLNLPRIGNLVPGDLIVKEMTARMNAHPDRAVWLENLQKQGAGYLVVMKQDSNDLDPDPPELRFALEKKESGVFVPIYDDGRGIVFRINWK